MKITTFFRNHRRSFVWLAAAFIWLFFGSRYLHFLLYLVHQVLPSLEAPLTKGQIILYPLDWLFTYLGLYIGLSVFGLLLAVTAIVWGRPSWQGRIVLVGGLVVILAMPTVYRYQPAVNSEAGYVMRVPTEPSAIASVVKVAQAGTEVRRCEYELLGWSRSEGALYGAEVCRGRKLNWVYWPMSDHYQRGVPVVPDDLMREEVNALIGVHSAYSLNNVIHGPVLRSPEGWWNAFIARYIYGPEDVVVVSTSAMAPPNAESGK